MVKMIAVASSNVEQIGYDKRESRLFVRYRDGGKLYVYSRVPEIVWLGLLNAQSKGSYLQEQIKGFFEYGQCDEDEI